MLTRFLHIRSQVARMCPKLEDVHISLPRLPLSELIEICQSGLKLKRLKLSTSTLCVQIMETIRGPEDPCLPSRSSWNKVLQCQADSIESLDLSGTSWLIYRQYATRTRNRSITNRHMWFNSLWPSLTGLSAFKRLVYLKVPLQFLLPPPPANDNTAFKSVPFDDARFDLGEKLPMALQELHVELLVTPNSVASVSFHFSSDFALHPYLNKHTTWLERFAQVCRTTQPMLRLVSFRIIYRDVEEVIRDDPRDLLSRLSKQLKQLKTIFLDASGVEFTYEVVGVPRWILIRDYGDDPVPCYFP